MFLIQTYSIEDCVGYDSMTSNSNKFVWDIRVTHTYSDSGCYITTNANSDIKNYWDLSNYCSGDFEISGTVIRPSGSSYQIAYLPSCNNFMIYHNRVDSKIVLFDMDVGWSQRTEISKSISSLSFDVRVTVINNTATLYIDDVLVGSKNIVNQKAEVNLFAFGSTRAYTVKNIKLKPL